MLHCSLHNDSDFGREAYLLDTFFFCGKEKGAEYLLGVTYALFVFGEDLAHFRIDRYEPRGTTYIKYNP